MGSGKRRLLVDFDGVLHSYDHGWTGTEPFDPPVPGAADGIRELLARGYDVIVFNTFCAYCPATPGSFGIRRWLLHWGFPEEWARTCIITDHKLPAMGIIDDRAIRFEGDWMHTLAELSDDPDIRPWNKR